MYKLILLIVMAMLASCSSTNNGIKYVNKSPRGISVVNVTKAERVKAFRAAESHCAKYYKVPRVLKSTSQSEESDIPMTTMVFECLKPSN